jgi:hypothetical protein
MWIFFPNAMLSIVAHRDKPDRLLVRARLRGDLERTFPGVPVSRTPHADYLYRVEVSRSLVAELLAEHVDTMTYTNVKGAIPAGDLRRKRAMHDVWAVMNDAQHTAEPFAGQDAYADTAPVRPRLFSGAEFQHTTAKGRPCVVTVLGVQERVGGEPDVSLEWSGTEHRTTMRLTQAQHVLRDSALLP